MLAPQLTPCSFLHWPLPLQVFEPVQEGESSTPEGTFEHVPRLPDTLQAWQLFVQVLLQQIASAQMLPAHSPFIAQFLPFDFLHWPLPLQM